MSLDRTATREASVIKKENRESKKREKIEWSRQIVQQKLGHNCQTSPRGSVCVSESGYVRSLRWRDCHSNLPQNLESGLRGNCGCSYLCLQESGAKKWHVNTQLPPHRARRIATVLLIDLGLSNNMQKAVCLLSLPAKNAPNLGLPLFFFLFPPLQAKHVLPHYVLVCARPRLLTQTRCNLFNPPLSWADKAWPPNTLLHLTQPRGIVFHFITSSSATAYRFGGWRGWMERHIFRHVWFEACTTHKSTHTKKNRSETHTPRLSLLTRPLNVITHHNVKLKIHIPADPWSSHNWHTSIFFFFCCGYWLMKLKANEIISQGEDIRGSIFRRTYNDYRPPTPSPHLTSFLRQRSFTFT